MESQGHVHVCADSTFAMSYVMHLRSAVPRSRSSSSSMKRGQLVVGLVGVIMALLGLLWFLQGAAILRLCPVLCIIDCECITSGSQFWEAVGGVVFIAGIMIVGVSVRRAGTPRS